MSSKKEPFKAPGVYSDYFETVKKVQLGTIATGSLSTLKEFSDKQQQILFSPGIPYAFFYEQGGIDFDPIFSDLPDKYRTVIKQLSPLPAAIIDGFFGNQAIWNRTLWTIPASEWVEFCALVGSKAYVDDKNKMIIFLALALSNAEDILAKVKGKPAEFVSIAHIDIHTNRFSVQMSESINTTVLSIAKTPPDFQIAEFANKLFKEDNDIVNDLPSKTRLANKIVKPDAINFKDLSPAAQKTFRTLKEYYRNVFDTREAATENE